MPPTGSAPLYLVAGDSGMGPRGVPDPLLEAAIRGTGVSRPRVAYVGAASGDDSALRLHTGRILKKAGAGTVTLAPLCGRRGSLARAVSILEDADLVFISGGDVDAGMKVLHQKNAVVHLRRLRRAGKPFIGFSAGSIMMARRWVRWSNPSDEGSAELFACLGLAPLLCDTHGEADGWSELRAMLWLSPVGSSGFGICSGAGLLVRGRGDLAALGGEVHVFKRRKGDVARLDDLPPTALPEPPRRD